jgi:hypothetical protein
MKKGFNRFINSYKKCSDSFLGYDESSPGRPVTLLPYLFHRVLRGCYTRDVGVFARMGGLCFRIHQRKYSATYDKKSAMNKRVTSS